MHSSDQNRKLTDREIGTILTASDHCSDQALAARFGVCPQVVQIHRSRRSKLALRVARRMGLNPPPKPEITQTLVKR